MSLSLAYGQRNCDKVSYRSPDLINWRYNGPCRMSNYRSSEASLMNIVLNLSNPVNLAACSGLGSHSRLKVIYNERTQKYVFDGFGGLVNSVGASVFTSDLLRAGYTYAGRMVPSYGYLCYVVEGLGLSYLNCKGY
jgi:hypothetical protein